MLLCKLQESTEKQELATANEEKPVFDIFTFGLDVVHCANINKHWNHVAYHISAVVDTALVLETLFYAHSCFYQTS